METFRAWQEKLNSLPRNKKWQLQWKVLNYTGIQSGPEKAMAPHSSTLAWKIPWTEEPGGLQSMGSLRVGHDWATSFSLFTFCIGEGNGNPFQCSCLENPKDGGAWWAAVYGVAQSRTRLKLLSSSSSTVRPATSKHIFPKLALRALLQCMQYSSIWVYDLL